MENTNPRLAHLQVTVFAVLALNAALLSTWLLSVVPCLIQNAKRAPCATTMSLKPIAVAQVTLCAFRIPIAACICTWPENLPTIWTCNAGTSRIVILAGARCLVPQAHLTEPVLVAHQAPSAPRTIQTCAEDGATAQQGSLSRRLLLSRLTGSVTYARQAVPRLSGRQSQTS